MKKIFSNKFVYIPLIAVLVLFLIFIASGKNGDVQETVAVKRGVLVQEVSLTGTVVPFNSVNLSFEEGGRVVSVPKDVGNKVSRGDVLASLDTVSLVLDLREAESSLAANQATLDKLKRGARAEDVAVLKAKYDAAQSALQDARAVLVNSIRDSYTRADDAVRNYGDQLFDNARSASPQLVINVSDDQLKVNIISARVRIEQMLVDWQESLVNLNTSSSLLSLAESARVNLNRVMDFLNDLSQAVNSAVASQTLSQTSINTYKTNVSTARTSVNTGIAGLTSSLQSFNNKVSELDLAQKNIDVSNAGTDPQEIRAAEARVLGDQARIESIKHRIAISSLRAPFSGVVTKQSAKIGQVVAPNVEVVSLMGEGFKIEANVPEADIAKLSEGQNAEITLDAYGQDVIFSATITNIDPSETLIDNVATYKVTFTFDQPDQRVRSGMTANIDVQSARKENALLLPVRAVLDRNGEKVVRIPAGKATSTEKTVKVGLRGSDGQVEIVSGLSEGDLVIVGTK